MIMIRRLILTLLVALLSAAGVAEESTSTSKKYQALKYPPPTLGTTWSILDRDGANRSVDPYLSSLGQGESSTGVVSSPPFVITSDTIQFTSAAMMDREAGAARITSLWSMLARARR